MALSCHVPPPHPHWYPRGTWPGSSSLWAPFWVSDSTYPTGCVRYSISPDKEEEEGNGDWASLAHRPQPRWASFTKIWRAFLLAICSPFSTFCSCFRSTGLVPLSCHFSLPAWFLWLDCEHLEVSSGSASNSSMLPCCPSLVGGIGGRMNWGLLSNAWIW